MLQSRRYLLHLVRKQQCITRRYYAEHAHSESAHSGSSSHKDYPPPPASEPIGRGLYIAIGGIALSLAIYKYTTTPSATGDELSSTINRWLDYMGSLGKQNAQINDLHTTMLQQASSDRSLFENEQPVRNVPLRFPDIFNTGSPMNVPAGHYANLDKLADFYRNKEKEMEEERLAAQKWAEGQASRQTKMAGGTTETVGRR